MALRDSISESTKTAMKSGDKKPMKIMAVLNSLSASALR